MPIPHCACILGLGDIPVVVISVYLVETISPYRYMIYYFDVALRGTAHFSDTPLFRPLNNPKNPHWSYSPLVRRVRESANGNNPFLLYVAIQSGVIFYISKSSLELHKSTALGLIKVILATQEKRCTYTPLQVILQTEHQPNRDPLSPFASNPTCIVSGQCHCTIPHSSTTFFL